MATVKLATSQTTPTKLSRTTAMATAMARISDNRIRIILYGFQTTLSLLIGDLIPTSWAGRTLDTFDQVCYPNPSIGVPIAKSKSLQISFGPVPTITPDLVRKNGRTHANINRRSVYISATNKSRVLNPCFCSLTFVGNGYIEGAIRSGQHAADLIRERLQQSARPDDDDIK